MLRFWPAMIPRLKFIECEFSIVIWSGVGRSFMVTNNTPAPSHNRSKPRMLFTSGSSPRFVPKPADLPPSLLLSQALPPLLLQLQALLLHRLQVFLQQALPSPRLPFPDLLRVSSIWRPR